MIDRVLFTPEADCDVADAYDWYQRQHPELGEDFLRCIETGLQLIQRHPRAFPVAVDEFRRALIRRFPFEIFYEVTDDSIVIHSVFHCSQDPHKWRERLGRE